ncbi:MAG: hypothetical protein ACM3P0_10565 [Acidobacteriota bacterium]
MTKPVFAAFLLILTMSGCARTAMIEKGQSAEEYYRSINEKCKGKYALLTLMDKKAVRVYNICLGTDSTSWTDLADEKTKFVQTGSVYSVQVTDRAGGAINGLGYGILGGALAGAALTALIDEPTAHPKFPVIFGVIGGALVGAVAGPILGVTAGEQYYFIINEKTQ